ncbi:phosphodiesterase [Denitrobaculum tricleocarpae]|uniref:Phosphodiesterase n=1 Tax=Denitrobaculum tricleocarpae TaxID=2591009 RepID=A0A545TPW2_9PROT|nr:phosphodiesterase [Denitrobaculum tricleocarpae]TQV79263.1 phosphodiesterase [Denitrobaculum tricleocarpae]
MTKIIQFTDTHIIPEGSLAYGKVDTAAALAATIETINRMLPVIGPVDMTIVTGDLTDAGGEAEYRHFLRIMSALKTPYRVIPGNHDCADNIRRCFPDRSWISESGPMNWISDFEDFALIGLDSQVEGRPYGDLSAKTLRFLQAALSELGKKPALVGLHHPPVKAGVDAMDRQNLRESGPLREILNAHEDEVRVICGHLHRSVTAMLGGVMCQIAPGTSHAVTLNQIPDAANSLTIEPGGFMLHEWRDGFVSHMIPVGRYEGPYPFTGHQ